MEITDSINLSSFHLVSADILVVTSLTIKIYTNKYLHDQETPDKRKFISSFFLAVHAIKSYEEEWERATKRSRINEPDIFLF